MPFTTPRHVNADQPLDRRSFVAWMGGVGASLTLVQALHAEVLAEAGAAPAWLTFTAPQAALVDAMTACIIPTDDAPGAHEAGVTTFIDRWIAKHEPESKARYAAGLDDLEHRVRAAHPQARSFTALTEAQQVALLQTIESGTFFALVRTHAIMGYLGAPSYGGNRGEAGWKAVGFENHGIWSAPFGWYDRPGHDAR